MSRKEGRVAMLINVMDIIPIDYVQKVVEGKLSDREDYRNKKANNGNESGQ